MLPYIKGTVQPIVIPINIPASIRYIPLLIKDLSGIHAAKLKHVDTQNPFVNAKNIITAHPYPQLLYTVEVLSK